MPTKAVLDGVRCPGQDQARRSKQPATALVPGSDADQRMARGLCVCLHGAGSCPSIFETWPASLPDWEVIAPDLQAGLDLSSASMNDYADAANRAAFRSSSDARVVVCGWSMGGLVALMAAPHIRPDALILLEPSLPAEIAGTHYDVQLRDGTYDPTESYGRWPDDPPTRPSQIWRSASDNVESRSPRWDANSSSSQAPRMQRRGASPWLTTTVANSPSSRIFTTSRSSRTPKCERPSVTGWPGSSTTDH